MKIVLGGAQFGKKYGLVEGNKIKKTELSKIYKIALKFNINLIDTSKNYGDSEKVIGKSSLKNLKIITKLDLPSKDININDWLNSQILDSLKKCRGLAERKKDQEDPITRLMEAIQKLKHEDLEYEQVRQMKKIDITEALKLANNAQTQAKYLTDMFYYLDKDDKFKLETLVKEYKKRQN